MLVPKSEWDNYKSLINQFHEDANLDEMAWYKPNQSIPRYGEEPEKSTPVLVKNLKVLFYYNYFRTWPITDYQIQGEVDKESVVALINIDYMRREGIADADGKLTHEPSKDYFVHRGQSYEASGESFLSQASDEPLLYMLILRRLKHTR